jgi:dipeptidyl aminopeptidase/acylaminoacyl peptidase
MTRAAMFAGAAVAAIVGAGAGTGAAGTPRVATERKDDLAAMFGARPAIATPALSPDGTRVVYLQPDGGAGTAAMVAPIDGSAPGRAIAATSGGAARLSQCDWADAKRIVCSTYMIQATNLGDRQMTLAFTRMQAFDADGGHPAILSQQSTGAAQLRISQYGGDVIDWMQGDTGKLLIERDHVPEQSIGTRLSHTADGMGVDLVDTRTLAATKVEDADPDAGAFLSDGRGTVRMRAMNRSFGRGALKDVTVWQYRRKGERTWIGFANTLGTGPGLNPLAIDPDTDSVYCLDKKDGRDALYRVSLDGTMRKDLVYADPHVDVTDVVRVGRRPRIVGFETTSETHAVTYFDPEYRALAASLSKALPKLPIVTFAGASADGTKLLIFAGSDVDPGRYYVFDRTTKHLNEIALARPALERQPLAAMTPVTFKAADGTPIPGYLTLPPGGAKTGLPAIVMPHGGPASHDEWGFDWLAQFYAARGYAVLQPEYRGSTGYGDDWQMKNGFKSWRVAIGDVTDAGRWLVAQGIADPAKLAIVGWSYGGYAALQSQVVAPDLFKAVVAVAPVTDLDALRNEQIGYTTAGITRDYIGTDAASIAAGSPARHAGMFKSPVMLFHGTLDRNVGVRESEMMDERLRAVGKDSRVVIYDGLDHSLPSGEIRADMLRRSDAFLRAALHMPAA